MSQGLHDCVLQFLVSNIGVVGSMYDFLSNPVYFHGSPSSLMSSMNVLEVTFDRDI